MDFGPSVKLKSGDVISSDIMDATVKNIFLALGKAPEQFHTIEAISIFLDAARSELEEKVLNL